MIVWRSLCVTMVLSLSASQTLEECWSPLSDAGISAHGDQTWYVHDNGRDSQSQLKQPADWSGWIQTLDTIPDGCGPQLPTNDQLKQFMGAGPKVANLISSGWNTALKLVTVDMSGVLMKTGMEAAAEAASIEFGPAAELFTSVLGMFDGLMNENGEIEKMFKELIEWVKSFVEESIQLNNFQKISEHMQGISTAIQQGLVKGQTTKEWLKQANILLANLRIYKPTILGTDTSDLDSELQLQTIAYISQYASEEVGIQTLVYQKQSTQPNIQRLIDLLADWAPILRSRQAAVLKKRMDAIQYGAGCCQIPDHTTWEPGRGCEVDAVGGKGQPVAYEAVYGGHDAWKSCLWNACPGTSSVACDAGSEYSSLLEANWTEFLNIYLDSVAAQFESSLVAIYKGTYVHLCPNSTGPARLPYYFEIMGDKEWESTQGFGSLDTAQAACSNSESCIAYGCIGSNSSSCTAYYGNRSQATTFQYVCAAPSGQRSENLLGRLKYCETCSYNAIPTTSPTTAPTSTPTTAAPTMAPTLPCPGGSLEACTDLSPTDSSWRYVCREACPCEHICMTKCLYDQPSQIHACTSGCATSCQPTNQPTNQPTSGPTVLPTEKADLNSSASNRNLSNTLGTQDMSRSNSSTFWVWWKYLLMSVACLTVAGLVMFSVWTLRPCWKQQTELTNPLLDDSIQIACDNAVPRMGSGRVDLKPRDGP